MHEGHRQRMRKKYLKYGIEAFSPHEILEMLLYYSKTRENTNPLAHELINSFGSLSGVIDADPRDLKNIKGIGDSSAVLIKLIKDVFEYYEKEKWQEVKRLGSVDEIGFYLTDMIGDKNYESLYMLCLDNSNKILDFVEVERGSVSSSAINVRKVLETAIRHNAEKVVLAHNHPSGLTTPSQEDIEMTAMFKDAFSAMTIKMIDHIIVGGNGFSSMAQKGFI